MAMTVLNNTAAQMTLGELNKNITQVGKDLAKISKGERIYGAAASASEYAISEKMRVKLRGLEQDERNVKNGSKLMLLAEGAIYNQLEIMRSIKERVINAANDTNTDEDRRIIQKEIDQYLTQIEDITYDTNYNGRRLLIGNYRVKSDVIEEWDVLGVRKNLLGQRVEWETLDLGGKDAVLADESSLDIIPNIYNTLDGVEGPFDVFVPYQDETLSAIPALSLQPSNNFTGGADGTPNHTIIDLSGYTSVDDLDGLNFTVGGYTYILAKDIRARYNDPANSTTFGVNYSNRDDIRSDYRMIDISGASSVEAVANILAGRTYSHYSSSSSNNVFKGDKVDSTNGKLDVYLKTDRQFDTAAEANRQTITATIKSDEKTKVIPAQPVYTNVPTPYKVGGTGVISGTQYLGGGEIKITNPDNLPDRKTTEGKPVTYSFNVSGAANKGITVQGYYPIKFVSGNSGLANEYDAGGNYTGARTIGVNFSGSVYIGSNIYLDMDGNGGATLRGPVYTDVKTIPPNEYYVKDGIDTTYNVSTQTGTIPESTETFKQLKQAKFTNVQDAGDSTRAHLDINIDSSKYSSAEDLIEQLQATQFNYNGRIYKFYDSESGAPEFYNRHKGTSTLNIKGSQAAYTSATWIDLASLRKAGSPKQELSNLIAKSVVTPSGTKATITSNGVRLPATSVGEAGNSNALYAYQSITLAHYDVNFTNYFASHPDIKLPDDLYGKGFQVYCASDPKQWFNFNFTGKVIEGQDDKPEVENAPDIKNVFVDISEVKEPADLVKKIAESANAQLAVIDNGHDHYIYTEAKPSTGTLRIYDYRLMRPEDDPAIPADHLQERGAKISDGLMDYLSKRYINLYEDETYVDHFERALNRKEDRLIIHDTTKANRDITLHIPRMTLDQMFGIPENEFDKSMINVATKASRDALLGKFGENVDFKDKGYIDTAIDYLTDANTLIGAQIMRLSHTENKIVTENENTTASESVIRDADMAKEMTAFTKNNVIAQAAQSMLAQANQTMGSVLGLLQ